MDTYTLTKNGVTFTIERSGRTTATMNGSTAIGWLAGPLPVLVYPRIEFEFHAPKWLMERADSTYRPLDEYDDPEDALPPNSADFTLTDDDVCAIREWLMSGDGVVAQPQQERAPREHYAGGDTEPIEPIYAIGGLNRGDGAELPLPYPKIGRCCRICGAAESDGAMFTTMAGGDICDDCF